MIENIDVKMVPVEGTSLIKSFYIGKYPVTQKEYFEVTGLNPSRFKGINHPVECVSWFDAIKFCNSLSRKHGFEPAYNERNGELVKSFTISLYSGGRRTVNHKTALEGYRLPTETEWEFAARGGNRSAGNRFKNLYYRYSGSNSVDEVAWYIGNSDSKTHAVGIKKPNELGIYDMSGNVMEWCQDKYEESYRVLRGGNCCSVEDYVSIAGRYVFTPSSRYFSVGLRIVQNRQKFF